MGRSFIVIGLLSKLLKYVHLACSSWVVGRGVGGGGRNVMLLGTWSLSKYIFRQFCARWIPFSHFYTFVEKGYTILHINQIYSGITCGRVLNGELYT